ncbi:MAG: FAD-dependent oxidoreductase [Actinobacteria bacterium]|nr:FAD-dependent oxidoreductase [Actinomycetota bacterium]
MPNRVLMPAMHMGMAKDGFPSDGFIDFYEERAKAGPGPGLMIIGGCYTEKRGMGAPNFVGLDDDKFIPRLKELTDRIHKYDSLIAAQLYHGGRYSPGFLIGEQHVSASASSSMFNRDPAHELSILEVEEVQENYAKAARRTREAGFDAVELICAAGYLVNQFLSPLTNKREDRYGGDIFGRMTFMLESIAAIKEATGAYFPLICRISGSDFVEGSHTLEETKVVAREMERAGVDLISVTGGWHETRVPQITMNVPRGAFVYLAEGIKDAVDRVPVAACNRINSPEMAEQVLAEGRADIAAMARAFLADPKFLRKAYEGRTGDIRTCIACNQGCLDNVFTLQPVTCMLNPRANRERETELLPAGEKKRVLVAGGGPGGMEAAWVAAHRGHRVTLCESSGVLGGQCVLAAVPPGREEFSEMVRYLERQLERKDVEVRLNTRVTAGLVKETKPDAVIMATGASQILPGIDGIDGPNVVYAWDVLAGNADTGRTVVVVGGGAVGVETGMFLAERGRDVTVLEMLEKLGADIGISTRWTILKDARELGVKFIGSCCVQRITGTGVVAVRGGKDREFEADTVVVAVGSSPNNELEHELRAAGVMDGIEFYKVGDCKEARKAIEAIHEGFATGLAL